METKPNYVIVKVMCVIRSVMGVAVHENLVIMKYLTLFITLSILSTCVTSLNPTPTLYPPIPHTHQAYDEDNSSRFPGRIRYEARATAKFCLNLESGLAGCSDVASDAPQIRDLLWFIVLDFGDRQEI